MSITVCRALVVWMLLASSVLTSPGAQGAELRKNWRAIAERDLVFIHDTLRDAHPGALDEGGGAFRDWLDRGLRESMRLAKRVRNRAEAQALLRYYGVGFEDGHLAVVSPEGLSSGQWLSPGWLVAFRQGDYFVSHHLERTSAQAPPIGARVLSCDGFAPSTIIARDISPFVDRRVYLEATHLLQARFLTLHSRTLTPWRRLAHQCRLILPDGEMRTYVLRWRKIESLPPQILDADPPRQAVLDLGEGRYWVHVSTFSPDEDEVKDYQRMIDDLRKLADTRLIVFDARGNRGGNSEMGTELLYAALGYDYVEFHGRRSGLSQAYAVIRVSGLALNYCTHVLVPMVARQFGMKSAAYAQIQRLRDRLAEAVLRHQDWMQQSEENAVSTTGPAEPPRRSFAIALVTDARCASACLGFADWVKALPEVVHFGRPSSADSVYMEAARVALPSGLGQLVLPIKVWRNRPRGNNQPHIPDELFDGDIDDTEAVRQWVLERMASRNLEQSQEAPSASLRTLPPAGAD